MLISLQAIVKTERGKSDIMKIFAMLPNSDVKRVYDLCDMYLDNFEGNQSDEDYEIDESNDDDD